MRKRPLEGSYRNLWLDSFYLEVREGGRLVDLAVLVASAASAKGKREVLGPTVAEGETASAWSAFLESLKQAFQAATKENAQALIAAQVRGTVRKHLGLRDLLDEVAEDGTP